MPSFDYFVASLTCCVCGVASPADASTNMQTKIARDPQLREMKVGDEIIADWADVPLAGYILINPPRDVDSMVILDVWDCVACGTPFNWARIEISRSIVQSIASVELSASEIGAANYISEDCAFLVGNSSDVRPENVVSELCLLLRREDELSQG